MKKLILLLLLTSMSGGALAEWVTVIKEDSVTTYANPATIRKQGSKVRMWNMHDYGNNQSLTGDPYQSMLLLAEYDCGEARYRSLHLSVHIKNMGNGNLLYATEADDFWRPTPPGSVAEALLNFACHKSDGLYLNY